jgi:hypothetical protein
MNNSLPLGSHWRSCCWQSLAARRHTHASSRAKATGIRARPGDSTSQAVADHDSADYDDGEISGLNYNAFFYGPAYNVSSAGSYSDDLLYTPTNSGTPASQPARATYLFGIGSSEVDTVTLHWNAGGDPASNSYVDVQVWNPNTTGWETVADNVGVTEFYLEGMEQYASGGAGALYIRVWLTYNSGDSIHTYRLESVALSEAAD